ncbi:MAG: hydrogenase iron-sulfur subunit [Desulfobacter sp.]|nr:hydrogenase iron-sulfur subunit [Desulfobacter sp.]WDP85766.1 MAG: hydrogenase iron-sulfur subunit [Desulfobacter sp.]
MRLKIPTSFRIIRLPCTGKLDIIHVLRAFEKGADGVFCVGCMEGDCHFNEGNFRARKRIEQAARLLDQVGVGGERVRMYNLSSGEGPLFAQYATEMVEHIKALGPSPIRLARQKASSEAA